MHPFGYVALNMGRCVSEGAGEKGLLPLFIRCGGGEFVAVEFCRKVRKALAPLAQQNRITERGGAIVIHQPGVRQFHAQRVIDDVADCGPVAGTGKTMGKAPIFQSIGDGTPASLNIRQYFDCSGQTPA
ncbi:hypothetical protein D3C78_1193080 [compost metagenome]